MFYFEGIGAIINNILHLKLYHKDVLLAVICPATGTVCGLIGIHISPTQQHFTKRSFVTNARNGRLGIIRDPVIEHINKHIAIWKKIVAIRHIGFIHFKNAFVIFNGQRSTGHASGIIHFDHHGESICRLDRIKRLALIVLEFKVYGLPVGKCAGSN